MPAEPSKAELADKGLEVFVHEIGRTTKWKCRREVLLPGFVAVAFSSDDVPFQMLHIVKRTLVTHGSKDREDKCSRSIAKVNHAWYICTKSSYM